MAYTTINKSSDYFNTKLYTGDGASTLAITGVGFQPDWTWIKVRTLTHNHILTDSVRGATKILQSNLTNAESTRANSLKSFDSDGFTLGDWDNVNDASDTFVSWNWLAGGTASSNTDGDITSQVSANTTSGFSIVKWTGNGTAGSTVGHGLGSEMKFMILKDYSLSRSWLTYHTSLGGGSGINFNESGQVGTNSGYWNNISPTSSVFSTGTYSNENNSNYICYCFAEKKGFSKFGSYTGNGSTDGTFVYTGFKPAWVLLKNTTGDNWTLLDSTRDIDNPASARFLTNQNFSEGSSNTIDFYSNGFKLLRTDAGENGNGVNYIYMAFAENPLVGTNNIPATAR